MLSTLASLLRPTASKTPMFSFVMNSFVAYLSQRDLQTSLQLEFLCWDNKELVLCLLKTNTGWAMNIGKCAEWVHKLYVVCSVSVIQHTEGAIGKMQLLLLCRRIRSCVEWLRQQRGFVVRILIASKLTSNSCEYQINEKVLQNSTAHKIFWPVTGMMKR